MAGTGRSAATARGWPGGLVGQAETGVDAAHVGCREKSPLVIDHIEDWARVKRHNIENMIVLCANCHGRKGNRRGQIDRKSLRQYKANLAVINSRYSDTERRVLEVFAMQRKQLAPHLVATLKDRLAVDWPRGLSVQLPGTLRLMVLYLIKDGYVELAPSGTTFVSFLGSESVLVQAMTPLNGVVPDIDYYRLTPAGLNFLDAWLWAQPLEGDDDTAPNSMRTADTKVPTERQGPSVVARTRSQRSREADGIKA